MNYLLDERDGHIHTPFCPHGTKDPFEAYVETALKLGKKEISFTEHFPMPEGVTTLEFQKECSLLEEQVSQYIEAVQCIKQKYLEKIKINVGFEVDYIEGKETYTKHLLDQYGEFIEDSLLSVHFVKWKEKYYAIDILLGFEELLLEIGSVEKIYDLYFETILHSIEADLGSYKPKRIGHPTLIRIFNHKYPITYEKKDVLEKIAKAMAVNGYEVDFNVAGLRKPLCNEVYPSGYLFECLKKNKVKMIFGSDAHQAKDMETKAPLCK